MNNGNRVCFSVNNWNRSVNNGNSVSVVTHMNVFPSSMTLLL